MFKKLTICCQTCDTDLDSLREYDTENNTEKTVTLKIERTKDMSNAENFQWDYKGLTDLDNNRRIKCISV